MVKKKGSFTGADQFVMVTTDRQKTKLGQYLLSKSVNKSIVAKRTGISQQRLSALTIDRRANLRVKEAYLIALAIDVAPCDLFKYVCSDYKLKES